MGDAFSKATSHARQPGVFRIQKSPSNRKSNQCFRTLCLAVNCMSPSTAKKFSTTSRLQRCNQHHTFLTSWPRLSKGRRLGTHGLVVDNQLRKFCQFLHSTQSSCVVPRIGAKSGATRALVRSLSSKSNDSGTARIAPRHAKCAMLPSSTCAELLESQLLMIRSPGRTTT